MTPFTHPVVLLAGKKRAGKDTVAEHLVGKYGFTRFAFADAVRAMAEAIDPYVDGRARLSDVLEREGGWEQAKAHPEVRRILQVVGTEAGRGIIGETVWVDILERGIRALGGPAVVSDCRFPNEADWGQARGAMVVRIRRAVTDTVEDPHLSEALVDTIEADYAIHNDGTLDDLAEEVEEMVRWARSWRHVGK